MIIDTHMHIYDPMYKEAMIEVINESLKLGVEKMIVVGCDYKTSLQAYEIAKQYDFIYAAVGLHPSDSINEKDRELNWLEQLLKNNDPKIVAVGEIGLDYYWDKNHKEEQKEFFVKQINLAKKYDLPVIIHCRDAINDCYQILLENKIQGVMHCFSSSYEMAKQFVKMGIYIGVGGVVTFKNSKDIKEVVKGIDLQYLLTETDSPYLSPVPFRGKINIPGYTKYVVEKIAEIKAISVEEVCEQVEHNVSKLFKI